MPNLPMKACAWQWCPEVIQPPERYCPEHKSEIEAQDREHRGSANERGYTYKWQKESTAFRHQNPLCAECLRQGRVKPADVVDHIIPHKGDMKLFWSRSNWQSLCTDCHNEKTAKEDAGLGRSRE